MKLKTLDQIHISSVSSDTLAPGTEFHTSAAAGEELLKRHPAAIVKLSDEEPEPAKELEEVKMDRPPENKSAGPAPESKAAPKSPPKPAPSAKPKGE